MVIDKKRVWIPPNFFEYIGPDSKTQMSNYRCLLGCPEPKVDEKTNKKKYLKVANSSRFNARRHVQVSVCHLLELLSSIVTCCIFIINYVYIAEHSQYS